MKKLIIAAISLGNVILCSCNKNNYVLHSANNPFIDSSKVANLKLIGAPESGQAQTSIRVYKNLVAMGDVFLQINRNVSNNLNRFAYHGGLAYNFYPVRKDRTVGFSIGGGLGSGQTNYAPDKEDFNKAQYEEYYMQIGINIQANDRHNFVLLYNPSLVHYNYYNYSREESFLFSPWIKDVFFEHKEFINHKYAIIYRLKISPNFDILFDQGFALKSRLISGGEILDNDGQITYDHSRFSKYYFRFGLQFNLNKQSEKSN